MWPSLDPIHRLDLGTTGVLVLSTQKSTTQAAAEIFSSQKAKKEYRLLTEHSRSLLSLPPDLLEIQEDKEETRFVRIKSNAFFSLWAAFPKSGKTHQVRRHASKAGIPILGDREYGGSAFPHLCLHAQSLELPGLGKWNSEAPLFFNRMGLLRNYFLCELLSHWDRRLRLYGSSQNLRLMETEDWIIDFLPPVLWIHNYQGRAPSRDQILSFQFVTDQLKPDRVVVQQRLNRGADPLSKPIQIYDGGFGQEVSDDKKSWIYQEEEVGSFKLHTDRGQSYGIFLDQRDTRRRIKQLSKNKKVLNLFCYSGGFSVAAALGGALEVISVDTSSSALIWSQENFALNDLDPSKYSFLRRDVRDFLKSCESEQFDLIICDPPTFARSKSKVFQIEKEAPFLIESCHKILSPGGSLFFSCNTERLKSEKIELQLQKIFGSRHVSPLSFPPDHKPHGGRWCAVKFADSR